MKQLKQINITILFVFAVLLSTCGRNKVDLSIFGKEESQVSSYGDLYVSKLAYDNDPNQTIGVGLVWSAGYTTLAYADAAGKPTYILQSMPDGKTAEIYLDAAGDITTVKNSTGESMQYTYSGDNITVTFLDANGATVTTKTFVKADLDGNNLSPLHRSLIGWDSFFGGILTTLKLGSCPASLVKDAFTGGVTFAVSIGLCGMAANTIRAYASNKDAIKLSEQAIPGFIINFICTPEELKTKSDKVSSCLSAVFNGKENGIKAESTVPAGHVAYTCFIEEFAAGVNFCVEGSVANRSDASCTDDQGRSGKVSFDNIICGENYAAVCTHKSTLPGSTQEVSVKSYYYGASTNETITMVKSLPGCS